MIGKFFVLVKKYQRDIVLITGVILVSLLSFAMGYLSRENTEGSFIITDESR